MCPSPIELRLPWNAYRTFLIGNSGRTEERSWTRDHHGPVQHGGRIEADMKPLLTAALFGIAASAKKPTSSTCIQTAEVKPDDPFQYTMAVLESLSYARSAFRPTTLPVNSDALMQISDLIFRIKAADLDYGCAAELLRGYQKSKEPTVYLAALNSVLAYQSVIDLDKESVVLMKRLAGDGADRISPGDLAEKMVDIRLRKSEQWDTISLLLLGVTQTLVSKVPDR